MRTGFTGSLQWCSCAGSVEDLSGHLKEIVQEERAQREAGELPEDAPAPVMKAKTFKELGTRTAQALRRLQSSGQS